MTTKPTKILRARVQICNEQPFFATLLLQTKIVESRAIPTFAVSERGTMYYNPEFAESFSPSELVFVLSHELMHKYNMHVNRRQMRHPMLWNVAADAVINDLLQKSNIGSMPQGAVNMPGSGDKTPEQIYTELEQQSRQNGGKGDPSSPWQDIGAPGEGEGEEGGQGEGEGPMTASEMSAQKAEMERQLAQAKNVAKMQGKLPAHIERFVDGILYRPVPWYQIMERWMTEKVKQDMTWLRPNRRYIGEGVYMPSYDAEPTMGELVIGVDTSGSIGEETLRHFSGHVNAIMQTTRPKKIHVVYCDAEVNRVDEFTSDDLPLQLSPCGGGGTDMRKIFDWIGENGVEPAATIILTDCYTPFPEEVSHPAIWASTTDKVAPPEAGETVRINAD